MSASDDYAEFVIDQLSTLKGITRNKFFGGVGLSAAGVQFAMIMRSTLYFVVDSTTRPKFEAMGSQCFSYSTKKKTVNVNKYFSVPVDVIEDPEQLASLAREAIRVANSAKR